MSACRALCRDDLGFAHERDTWAQVTLSVAPGSPPPPHTEPEALPPPPESFLSKMIISASAEAKCEEGT